MRFEGCCCNTKLDYFGEEGGILWQWAEAYQSWCWENDWKEQYWSSLQNERQRCVSCITMKKKVNIVKGMPSQKRDKILYDEDNVKKDYQLNLKQRVVLLYWFIVQYEGF